MDNSKLNPFYDDADNNSVDSIRAEDQRSSSEQGELQERKSATAVESFGLDAIATRLLDDRLFLTALELHMELLESGHELNKLRDFFSNPANFERMTATRSAGTFGESSPPRLARASSIQTFDSLDFARYSDDGERTENDRVAVLEFELRNAQDTIRSLRATLTKTATSEQAGPTESTVTIPGIATINEPAQPYERRALNFLVNEYLLHQDYKLTAVTFSEENANQDFEDWDDVGINIAKPPDLLNIYRDYGQQRTTSGAELVDVGTCTDPDLVLSVAAVAELQEVLSRRIKQLEAQVDLLEAENSRLLQTVAQLEQYPNRGHPAGSTPAVSPIKPSNRSEVDHENGLLSVEDNVSRTSEEMTPESACLTRPTDQTFETALEELPTAELLTSPLDVVDVVETAVSSPSTVRPDADGSCVLETVPTTLRKTGAAFHQLLLSSVFHVLPDNRIFGEVSRIAELDETAVAEMVPLLARCLPHIVPNVLLAAREELIPLIVSAAALHADSSTRDRLLNLLFNLIKRPDVDQRQMILLGCVAFARHAGGSRVESELLPQCWEQLAHRHVERRLLVAEASGTLAPHIPSELRGSLLLSMLQQMLEDGAEDVREAAVRSLGVVVGFVDDVDKYQSIETVMFSALRDGSEKVRIAVKQIFLPSLALWALDLGYLESNLLTSFIDRIEDVAKPSETGAGSVVSGIRLTETYHFLLLLDALCELLPIAFCSFLLTGPFDAVTIEDGVSSSPGVVVRNLPKPTYKLLDVAQLLGSEDRLSILISHFEEYVAAEWYHQWRTYTWVTDELVSHIVSVAECLDASEQSVVHSLVVFFRCLCQTFGPTFSRKSVQPRFHSALQFPPSNVTEMSLLEHASLVRCTAPVFAAGVLAAFPEDDDDRTALSGLLNEFISATAVHQCSLVGVVAAVTELCLPDEVSSTLLDVLLAVLWDCVVHSSIVVRATAARLFEPTIRAGGVSESLVATRVVPALVTLAGDSSADVRAATVGAFGATIECVSNRAVLDKVYMQLQSLMDDMAYRDEHALHVALIRALGHAGPSCEPRFRDDFILPRLTALAVQNSGGSAGDMTTARRTDIAMALFDAYSSVSCCFVGDQLVGEVLLPGIRCLHRDLLSLVPDHAPIVASMIREFEDRIDSGSGVPARPASTANESMSSPSLGTPSQQSAEGIRFKMMGHIKDVKDRASHSNISRMFNTSKK